MSYIRISYIVLALLYSISLVSSPKEENFQIKPLDGIVIEAVESYINPKHHNVQISFGLNPFEAYYFGFSFNAAYCYNINYLWAWNIIHGSYIFPVEKGLTAELAEKYGVNPETIKRVNGLIGTELLFTPIYGKSVLLREIVDYFRLSFSLGTGVVFTGTSQSFSDFSSWSLIAGIRLETQMNETLSWHLILKNNLLFHDGFNDIISFLIGTGVYF